VFAHSSAECGEVISDEKFIYDILARLTASEYAEVGQRIQEKLQPREAAYKRRPKLTPEQIEAVPIPSIKEVKELLRNRWECLRKEKDQKAHAEKEDRDSRNRKDRKEKKKDGDKSEGGHSGKDKFKRKNNKKNDEKKREEGYFEMLLLW